jgi:hypothetical protein
MTPRLMVICLGGLAGAGAVVCCDLNEGLEELDVAPDGEAVDAGADGSDPVGNGAEPAPTH